MIDHALDTFLIFIGGLLKHAVEAGVEAGHKTLVAFVLLSFVRFQEHGAKGRRECQGVDSRDDDTHSHGHTELAVEGTACATHKRHRDEHGSHDERDGDDGAGDLVHGVDSSRERVVVALVKLGVDGLDDHDGIIDHDGDSQQQRRQRQQVDGESKDPQEEEGTYQSYRYGDHWDERRAEILQEDIHHDEHKEQRDEQRHHHLMDRGEEEVGHVVHRDDLHPRRHALLLLSKSGLYVSSNLCSVRSCDLLHHTHTGRLSVVVQTHVVHQ